MAQVCKTCGHPERRAIDLRLAEGAPNRRIAAQYGISEAGIRSHKANHLSKAVAKAAQTRVEAQAQNILSRLESLIADARAIAEAAVKAEKFAAAQSGIRNMISTLELIARLTGQLGEGSTTVNIAVLQQAKSEEQEIARLRRLSSAAIRQDRDGLGHGIFREANRRLFGRRRGRAALRAGWEP